MHLEDHFVDDSFHQMGDIIAVRMSEADVKVFSYSAASLQMYRIS